MTTEQPYTAVIAALDYLVQRKAITPRDRDEAVAVLSGEWSPWPPGTARREKLLADWYHRTFCRLEHADRCSWEYETDNASGGHRRAHEQAIRSALNFARNLDSEVLDALVEINHEGGGSDHG